MAKDLVRRRDNRDNLNISRLCCCCSVSLARYPKCMCASEKTMYSLVNKSPVVNLAMRFSRVFVLLSLLICYFHCPIVSGTLSPSSKTKGKSKEKELTVRNGPISEMIFDRGLLEDEPSSKSIILESGAYYEDTSLRNFNSTILGYVTPVSGI